MSTIKALSLWQPWASLIALDLKRIETRDWATKYRGPLLIHAGKNTDFIKRRGSSLTHRNAQIGDDARTAGGLPRDFNYPLGALVAIAELVDCLPTKEIALYSEPVSKLNMNRSEFERELALGNFTPGRFGWVLAHVRELPEPLPYRGRQGLFDVPAGLIPPELRP